MLKLVSLLCVMTLLVGCSALDYASNEPQKYLKSKNGKNLDVPSSLNSNNLSDFYRLPNQPQNAKLKASVAYPKVKQEG